MKRRNWIILIIVILVGIYLYSHYVTVPDKKAASNTTPVTVATVIQKDVVITTEAVGQVQPYHNVSVTSQVDGQLEKVAFQEGDIVKQGQLLFQIDARPYQAKLAQAQGTLANDKAQLGNAQLLLKRYTTLEKKGYVAQQDYDQAKANEMALQATVQADEAAVEQAQLQLNYCTIYAPITGKTGNVLVKAGNIVAANTTNFVSINQMQPIYVSFNLPEKQLDAIQQELQKKPILITAKTTQNKIITGKLTFINNTIDTTTGTIQFKGTFQNENNALWPGQFIRVSIPLTSLSQAIIAPVAAIQQGQEGSYVYLLKNNNTVQYQSILSAEQTADGVIITKGLEAGDKVVTAGQLRLNDGSHVSVQTS